MSAVTLNWFAVAGKSFWSFEGSLKFGEESPLGNEA